MNDQTPDSQPVFNTAAAEKRLYKQLNILDAKCSALLQLASLVMVLNSIPFAAGGVQDAASALRLCSTLLFFASCIPSIVVLQVDWNPSVELVNKRTRLYKVASALVTAGLICMLAVVIASSF